MHLPYLRFASSKCHKGASIVNMDVLTGYEVSIKFCYHLETSIKYDFDMTQLNIRK